ncbi:helix-turn-helix transcriptional regulator [Streptomyces sp. NPDC049577]|uniref:helix-turn-helix transcriptional regulator n=1 Tax=Streptomyces sp. NPDC049577 TaxID=3155153 RepID=UPI00341501D6
MATAIGWRMTTRSGGVATFRSDRMREHRQRAGLSVEELALLAGVSPETVRKAESGARKPTGRVVVALADALRVSVEVLAPPGAVGRPTLKQLRQRTGRTQREVAEFIGMSSQMVSRVEAGVYRASDPGRWAPAYDVTPEQWLSAWQAGRDERRQRIEGARGGSRG